MAINEKIIPQYVISLEADDAALIHRAKELPITEGSHHNDAGMVRRLKEYRARNVDDSGTTTKDFFAQAIGHLNVLAVNAMMPEKDQLSKMEALIEQKGKPCCINMITENDKKFLMQLEKDSKKRPKTGDAEDHD